MNFLKINFLFYLSYRLRLLSIVCGDIESNPGLGSDRRVWASILIFVVFMPILINWCDVLVCADSKVSDRRHLSELLSLALVAHNRSWWPLLCPGYTAPGAQGMAPYVREGFRSLRQNKLECSCHESCVFRICSRLNNFYVFVFYRNTGRDGSLYNCLIDSITWRQSLSLLVMPMPITLSGWSQSLLQIHMGVLLLIFVIRQVVNSWWAVQLTLQVIDSILWWPMSLTSVGTLLGS